MARSTGAETQPYLIPVATEKASEHWPLDIAASIIISRKDTIARIILTGRPTFDKIFQIIMTIMISFIDNRVKDEGTIHDNNGQSSRFRRLSILRKKVSNGLKKRSCIYLRWMHECNLTLDMDFAMKSRWGKWFWFCLRLQQIFLLLFWFLHSNCLIYHDTF